MEVRVGQTWIEKDSDTVRWVKEVNGNRVRLRRFIKGHDYIDVTWTKSELEKHCIPLPKCTMDL